MAFITITQFSLVRAYHQPIAEVVRLTAFSPTTIASAAEKLGCLRRLTISLPATRPMQEAHQTPFSLIPLIHPQVRASCVLAPLVVTCFVGPSLCNWTSA